VPYVFLPNGRLQKRSLEQSDRLLGTVGMKQHKPLKHTETERALRQAPPRQTNLPQRILIPLRGKQSADKVLAKLRLLTVQLRLPA